MSDLEAHNFLLSAAGNRSSTPDYVNRWRQCAIHGRNKAVLPCGPPGP